MTTKALAYTSPGGAPQPVLVDRDGQAWTLVAANGNYFGCTDETAAELASQIDAGDWHPTDEPVNDEGDGWAPLDDFNPDGTDSYLGFHWHPVTDA